MTDPTDSLRTYVRTALELQGYAFSEERVAEIMLQFARIESIARTILTPAWEVHGNGDGDGDGDGGGAVLDMPGRGPAAVFRP